MSRRSMGVVTAAVVLASLAGARRASAQGDICPGSPLWGQAPDFWTADPGSPTTPVPRSQLGVRYDGRWAGASQVPLDNGSSGARVRYLDAGDGNLYIAMEIDATGNHRDVYWFGFAGAAAGDSDGATLLEVSVYPDQANPPVDTQVIQQLRISCGAPSCTLPAVPRAVFRVLRGVPAANGLSKFVWDTAAHGNTVAAAAWLDPPNGPASRAWRGPLYGLGNAAGEPNGGTLMLRVPNATFGGAALGDARVWHAAATCNSLGAGPVGCASQGNWPTAGEVKEIVPDEYSAPLVSEWATLRRTSACPVQPMLVEAGVQNEDPYNPAKPFTWPQRMVLDNDGNLGNDLPNHFAARISTNLATTAGRYKARFFIADWGSQIGNLDISQWTEIGNATNPGTGANTTEHLVLRWPPATATLAEHKALACKYSKCTSNVFGCPYPEDTMPAACGAGQRQHHPHQCTQVRLENVGTTSYQFAADAMIFNTDFVGASIYTREAVISTAGIATVQPAPLPAPPAGRDIYIYVRTANLPPKVRETPVESTVKRLELIATAAGRNPPGRPASRESRFARDVREQLGQRGNGPDALPRAKQQAALQRVRALPMSTVRAIAPTLEFFVYYDTGHVLDTSGGTTSKWLAPMTSFGYVAEHVGDVEGWEWALDGAESIGGNWYRMRIKDGGKKTVRTRIQAVDGKRMPKGRPRWPPGPGWINGGSGPPGRQPLRAPVTKTGGGCSSAPGAPGGAAAMLLIAGAIAAAASRRRRRAR